MTLKQQIEKVAPWIMLAIKELGIKDRKEEQKYVDENFDVVVEIAWSLQKQSKDKIICAVLPKMHVLDEMAERVYNQLTTN